MPAEVLPAARADLVFDGDGSQFMPTGHPCSLCRVRQTPTFTPPHSFVRVRERIQGGTVERAWLCPDCVARATMVANRLGYWKQCSVAVRSAMRRMFNRAKGVGAEPAIREDRG